MSLPACTDHHAWRGWIVSDLSNRKANDSHSTGAAYPKRCARWLLSLSRMNNFSPVKCAESIEPLIFPIPGNFLGEISLIGRFPWFASGEIGGLWGKLYEVSLPSNSALRKLSLPLRTELALRGFSRRYYFIIRARQRARLSFFLLLSRISLVSLNLRNNTLICCPPCDPSVYTTWSRNFSSESPKFQQSFARTNCFFFDVTVSADFQLNGLLAKRG